MKIKQARLEDKKSVLKLVNQLYSRSSPKIVEKWKKDYPNIIGGTFLAEIKKEIVGYIAFGLKDDSVYIGDLYVLPKFRRQKIATKLINFVNKVKKNLNKKSLLVDVRKKDYNAQKLYKKIGFNLLKNNESNKDLITLRK